MTAHVEHGSRLIAASLLLTLAVAVSLLFQGITTNLVYLGLTAAALLAAIACVGTSAIAARLDTNRWSFALALAMLGYLIIAYRFSIRADNSFGASWVLAAGPLAFIGGSVAMQNATARRLLAISISTLVIALAAVSSVRFALFGERAHQPLDDPNNYATLMYLVWIPLAHRYLAKGWSGEKTTPVGHACVLASSFVLVFALIATRSRTAMVIVGGALVLWIAIAVFRRTAWKRLFALTGAVGLALIVSIAVTTLTDALAKGLELGGGLGCSVRADSICTGYVRAAPDGDRRVLFSSAVSELSFAARAGHRGAVCAQRLRSVPGRRRGATPGFAAACLSVRYCVAPACRR